MSTTALYQRLRIAGAAARDVLVRAAAQRWNIDGFGRAAPRTASSSTRAASGSPMASSRRTPPSCRSTRRRPEGPEPVSPDRQAGGAAGYAGQVQRQRGVRHRRRGAGNAERRDQDRAFLQRAGDGDQERGRYSQDARRARSGEDRGAGDRQRGRRLPASARSASAASQRGLRRRRSFLAGQARDSMRSTWSSTAAARAISRAPGSTPCWTAGLDAERAVTALVRGEPSEILKERAGSIIERRFVLPHIAHAPLEPVNATASYQDGTVEVWGSDPIGHRVPGGGGASGRLRRRRREDQCHVSRRQLRPQDRPGLRAAGGAGVARRSGVRSSSRARAKRTCSTTSTARTRAAASRGPRRRRLSAGDPCPRRRPVAVRRDAQELARPDAGGRLGREHGRRHLQSELSAAAFPGGDGGHAVADPGLLHALGRLDRGGILLGELHHRARPSRQDRPVWLPAQSADR